jgi:hypothetical protein
MSQSEVQHLAHIRENGVRTNRLLQTINSNIIELHKLQREGNVELRKIGKELTSPVDIDKVLADGRKLQELSELTAGGFVYHTNEYPIGIGSQTIPPRTWVKLGEQIKPPEYEPSGPDIGFSIPLNGVNWCLNDRVMVTDADTAECGQIGKVINARNWPENFQLAVVFEESHVQYEHFVWLRPDQLDKSVEQPAVLDYVTDTNGCLFPWQWRHNLGFDKISEDLREYHRTHENHPMTEEAFRIYNAGLTAELAVKEKQEEQS